MNRVYIITPNSNTEYDFASEIAEIREIDPVKIYCMVEGETDGKYIFRHFLANIESYLQETNKEVVLVISNPDNVRLSNHVVTNTSCGMTLPIYNLIKRSERRNLEFNWEQCDKSFTCYNNNDKFHRYILIDKLLGNGLVDSGYVTFNCPKSKMEYVDYILEGKYKLKHYDLTPIKEEQDFVLNAPTRPDFSPMSYPKNYFKGFIDILPETNYEKDLFFVTEKTGKPVASLKPFLSVANQYYHKYLQEFYNMELYTELFDYSFDSCENVQDRIDGIIENLKRVNDMFIYNRSNLITIYNDILPKLKYNRACLRNIINNKDKMVPNKLKFLIEQPVEIYGDKNTATFNIIRMNNWAEL